MDVAYRPKIGLNRKFPNAVVHGPPIYCGLPHPPFCTQQGYKQLQLLTGTTRNRDDTGDLEKVSLKYEQQESGYISPLLSGRALLTYQQWPPSTWIGSIRKILTTMKATIHIYDQWCPTQQKENDVSLILHFQKRHKKKRQKVEQLNRYRVWLGVVTLSNIPDVSGTILCPFTSHGDQHPHRTTTSTWRN